MKSINLRDFLIEIKLKGNLANEMDVYHQDIANINVGKPVGVRVYGTRSRGHYVTIITKSLSTITIESNK